MNERSSQIGTMIRMVRKERKLTQNQLAKALGKTLRTVQKYESGEIELTVSGLEQIAKVLHVCPWVLLGYVGKGKDLHRDGIDDCNANTERGSMMAIFRTEKTKDYTVMSNYHLKDKRITLKAKGLLSQMLSLPEDWDYTMSGLCLLNKESLDAIRSAIRELEAAGYIVRSRKRDSQGRLRDAEYVIYEKPRQMPTGQPQPPVPEEPTWEPPTQENPTLVSPMQENPSQLNTKLLNTNQSSTNQSIFPFPSPPNQGAEGRNEGTSQVLFEQNRKRICQNISYQVLVNDYGLDQMILDEIVDLAAEIITIDRKADRIAGCDYPHKMVKDRLLALNMNHIQYVVDCLNQNTTQVRNAKQYLLTVLFNAPTTMQIHTMAQANHDMQI